MNSKTNSPLLYYSRTHSDELNRNSISPVSSSLTNNISNHSIPESWQRMNNNIDRDNENKRPPWRAVSVSTLQKPDKSAILRAKLLDASRRLRAGKLSVGIQTEIETTKFMKEVNLGAQTDLILYRDIGILTDGCYTKKRNESDQFILTYSVSQETDKVTTANVSTQTLLPKLSDYCELEPNEGFKKLFHNNDGQRNFIKDNLTSSLLTPTLSSWNFDYGEIGSELNMEFKPYILYPSNVSIPCCSYNYTLEIEYLHNHLKAIMTFVDNLLESANHLIDSIETIPNACNSMDPNKRPLNATIMYKGLRKNIYPSECWLPIIEKEEEILMKTVQS